MRDVGIAGCLLLISSVGAQTPRPVVSTLTIQEARENVQELQKQISAVLAAMPPLPAKDQFETTADYQRRTQTWFDVERKRLESLSATEERLKQQFYLRPDAHPAFDAYNADSEILTAKVGIGSCRFTVPRTTAKNMHDSWNSVAVAENLEIMASPLAEINKIRGQSKAAQAALALVFETDVFVGSGETKARALLSKVEPQLSTEARNRKDWRGGVVAISFVVGVDGKAKDFEVVKRVGMGLEEAAIDAVRQWRFSPGSINCMPVEQKATVEVSFRKL